MYTAASKTSVLGVSDAAMKEAPTATETHALHLARATRTRFGKLCSLRLSWLSPASHLFSVRIGLREWHFGTSSGWRQSDYALRRCTRERNDSEFATMSTMGKRREKVLC